MTPAKIKKAVREHRKPGESRNAHAKRVGIPFVTLGRMELEGKAPRNPVLRSDYLAKVGLSEAAS